MKERTLRKRYGRVKKCIRQYLRHAGQKQLAALRKAWLLYTDNPFEYGTIWFYWEDHPTVRLVAFNGRISILCRRTALNKVIQRYGSVSRLYGDPHRYSVQNSIDIIDGSSEADRYMDKEVM
jgi:hypothetical protein